MPKLNLDYVNSLQLLISRNDKINLVLVGCGGTGSWLAPAVARVARLLRERFSNQVNVTFVDPDSVEEKNIYRQNFCEAEIGRNKASALAERYGLAWGIEIFALAAGIDERNFASIHSGMTVFLGCVDNAGARQEIRNIGERTHNGWWLDCGNAKNSGQVLLGSFFQFDKAGFNIQGYCAWLPSPEIQHPELVAMENKEVTPEKETMSCAEMALRDSQGLAINQRMAAEAADYLVRLLITHDLRKYATYIDLESGSCQSKYITAKAIRRFVR